MSVIFENADSVVSYYASLLEKPMENYSGYMVTKALDDFSLQLFQFGWVAMHFTNVGEIVLCEILAIGFRGAQHVGYHRVALFDAETTDVAAKFRVTTLQSLLRNQKPFNPTAHGFNFTGVVLTKILVAEIAERFINPISSAQKE